MLDFGGIHTSPIESDAKQFSKLLFHLKSNGGGRAGRLSPVPLQFWMKMTENFKHSLIII